MGHTTVVQKGSEHRLCQKTKGKRKEEHFGPVSVVQQVVQQRVYTLAEALDNGYAS